MTDAAFAPFSSSPTGKRNAPKNLPSSRPPQRTGRRPFMRDDVRSGKRTLSGLICPAKVVASAAGSRIRQQSINIDGFYHCGGASGIAAAASEAE